MEERSELNRALKNMLMERSPGNMVAFSGVLKSYVDRDTRVFIPGRDDGSGFRFKVLEARGKHFAAMFSDQNEAAGMDPGEICLAGLSRLLDAVFHDPQLAGIVIDPFTNRACMEKQFLLRSILHGTYPALKSGGTEPKDWGDGIPAYTEDDRMTPAEIQNFALHSVMEREPLLKEGYTLISGCDYPGAMPSLIFEKDGAFTFLYIKAHTSLEDPELSADESDRLKRLGEKYCAAVWWAPVGFFSAEPDRFAAGLTLRGDAFFCRYEGLRTVE